MIKKLIIYLSSFSIAVSALYLAAASEPDGFRERMVRYIGRAAGDPDAEKVSSQGGVFLPGEDYNGTVFQRGDWSEYVSEYEFEEYVRQIKKGNIYSDSKVDVNTSGSVNLNLNYGKSRYTNSKYKQYDEDSAKSRVITSGFLPEQVMLLHMDGTIDNRITLFIDHDSRREDNRYMMSYRAVNDDEILREINAGEIDIRFSDSKYAVFDNTDAKGLGIDFTVRKGGLSLKGFGSIARGETMVEYFRGNSSHGGTGISDYQYVRRAWYQLEPFRRYDSVSSVPASAASVYSSITVTSDISTLPDPKSYLPASVNITPSGFELYIDDQNQYNNNNAIVLSSIDGGYYTKLVNSSDYSINYSTGVIHFLKDIPENSRIFAVYNRTGGTLDPCAISPGDPTHPGGKFSGKIFVFIKYGYSTDEDIDNDFVLDSGEDVNNDGKLNLDIYEIRSVYFLGARQILSSDFSLNFYNDNQRMSDDEINDLGTYRLDLTEGKLSFYTREPFRPYLDAVSSERSAKVYSEMKRSDSYLYSRFKVLSDYYVEARNFKLKYGNIIEKSVRVKVNEKVIPQSLYSVDYLAGYLSFTNQNNPVISSDSAIEIKYEYLPEGLASKKFMGGVRGDYRFNDSLRAGGSLMISKDGETETVPDVGKENGQTLLFEGDAELKLSSVRLADLFNIFSSGSRKRVPFEFSAYAEYARSYRDINSFGKGLIDNMETADEIVSVSLSEKDWILSSMPSGYTQGERGLLNYYFYRDPDSPDELKGTGFSAYSVDYQVKPGPFNVATGHIADSITKLTHQKSLVFDFDFSSGTVVSAVTRRLSDSAVDLSGVQYVEVWVRYEGGAGDSVDLYMDIGEVNEDSDGDGVLDTEDANRNGYIDAEPSTGYSEDRGYTFNPSGGTSTRVGSGPGLSSSTRGDGTLTSEDLNGNGTLDTSESVYTLMLGSTTGSPTISTVGGAWQKIRVYLNQSDMTASDIQTLQETRSLRVYLRQNSGTTGRVFIDTIKIVSSKWKNPELDGSATTDTDRIRTTIVNSINDSDYRADSFLVKQKGVYESLYGDESTDDISSQSESALQIDFDIPTGSQNVSLKRRFSTAIDLRHYKTMNLWLNTRVISPSSEIGIIIGSSDSDYTEFRYTPDYVLLWRGIKLKLSEGSNGDIDVYQVTGNPDFKRIRYLKVVVYGEGTSGTFWLNEIYVSDPERLEGDARWYELHLKSLEPLFRTKGGVPVLSDMNLRYIYKGHSSNFSTINKTSSDIEEKYHEIFSSVKILPEWDADFTYIKEASSTDSLNEAVDESKRGNVDRDYALLNSAFNSGGENPSSITVSYSIDKNRSLTENESDGYGFNEDIRKIVQTPVVVFRQELRDFLFGNLSLKMMFDMTFTELNTGRSSEEIDDTLLSSITALKESEKRQKANSEIDFNYSNGLFFIHPVLKLSASEYVQLEGSDSYTETGISDSFRGGFRVPFLGGDNIRYMERNKNSAVTVGLKISELVHPEYTLGADYREYGFKDYDESVGADEFNRSKNTAANLSTGIKLPFFLQKKEFFKRIKHLQIGYNRSVYLTETAVPYEGEGTGTFDEEYGISNVFRNFSSKAYNMFGYYPGYFFLGRGNSGNGRDMVYRTLNDSDDLDGVPGGEDYNNTLKLTDRFTADLSVSWDPVNMSMSGNIIQICERSNIYGIPNQVITSDIGTNFEFDMMKIFDFGFFRPNGSGLPHHFSVLNTGIKFTDSMLITSNINEKKFSPSFNIIFKWDKSSLSFKYELDCRFRTNEDYISTSLAEGDSDFIYLENMEGNSSFHERDYGNRFAVIYQTDVMWIYNLFTDFYKLTASPVFSVEYRMEYNRYDYLNSVSPEPYDLYMVKSDLTMDLHKNIKGNMSAVTAIENFRNRENNGVSSQVISWQITAGVSLIF